MQTPVVSDVASKTEADAGAVHLPSPGERPDADVVIYDGECSICASQIGHLLWWDCQNHLAYLSLHDPAVSERYADLSHDRLMEQMVIVDRQGRRHWGPHAIRYLTFRLRRLWWLIPLAYFPGSMLLWAPLYRWIARNRYRFGGKKVCDGGTCNVHR